MNERGEKDEIVHAQSLGLAFDLRLARVLNLSGLYDMYMHAELNVHLWISTSKVMGKNKVDGISYRLKLHTFSRLFLFTFLHNLETLD